MIHLDSKDPGNQKHFVMIVSSSEKTLHLKNAGKRKMAKIKKFPPIGKKISKDNYFAKMFEMIIEKCNEIIAEVNNQDVELNELKLQFAQLRLDLKSAMIMHDEPYVPPGVDELSPGSKQGSRKDSKRVKQFKKVDPF